MTEKNIERNAAVCAAFKAAGGQRNAITRIAGEFGIKRQRVHAILQAEGLIPARRGKEVTSNMPKKTRFQATLPGAKVTDETKAALTEIANSDYEGNLAAAIRAAIVEFVKTLHVAKVTDEMKTALTEIANSDYEGNMAATIRAAIVEFVEKRKAKVKETDTASS